ncbi:MAG: AAA family ATPase [Desulfobacterales bacterium]|nr:AAA family ATPase [Desulfobacterales bacterium]MBF0397873.1 AAA family ATPase [Desulfobacterales bacterium]
MRNFKAIPYGIADFQKIQQNNLYYVDKTRFIPEIEKSGDFLFLIRPRRFGKSLFLSILEGYYDISCEKEFDTLFQDTWIHEHPTENKNKYLILSFNFSVVNPDIKELAESFEDHVKNQFFGFEYKYKNLLDESYFSTMKNIEKSHSKLNFLLKYATIKGLKVYILIDEYDNFTNTILSASGKKSYHDITHGEGFLRYFFNVLKGGTTGKGAGLTNLFITGVSPVTMDDVTSGFNIGKNITTDFRFSEMLGLTETETLEMLSYYKNIGLLKQEPEKLYPIMTEWYNNYRFSEQNEVKVFNSDMVLYFVDHCIQLGSPPKDLIDYNVKTDYKKLRHLVVLDKQLNGNFSKLKEINDIGVVSSDINIGFPAHKLVDSENFISLLYYLGLLTIDHIQEGTPVFKIPNLTIKKLFYEYLREGFVDGNVFRMNFWDFSKKVQKMAYHGEWENVFDYIAEEIKKQTTIRDYLYGEAAIRGFLLAYINMVDFFITRCEFEMNKGFADVFFQPFFLKYPDMRYSYLMELKYIKRGEFNETVLKEKIDEASNQLEIYAKDEFIAKSIGNTLFQKFIVVFNGWEMVYRRAIS